MWITVVTVRKMCEGSGPWLRAVRKGVYQLPPTSMQRRILLWTEQDTFFESRTVRHAAPDAGVEQPGLVSVVLPVFNQADSVAGAIDNVLGQTYEPFELIIVDDGRSDDLHAVLRSDLDDPRVRVVSQPNQRPPKALGAGFEFVTGELFAWTSTFSGLSAIRASVASNGPATEAAFCSDVRTTLAGSMTSALMRSTQVSVAPLKPLAPFWPVTLSTPSSRSRWLRQP